MALEDTAHNEVMNRNRQPKTQNPKQPKERNGVSSPPSPSPPPPPRTLTRTRAHTPHPTIPPPIATATTTAIATPTLAPALLPGAAPLLRTVDPLGTVFPLTLGFGVKRTTLGLAEAEEAEEEARDTVRVDEGFRTTCVRAPRQ